MCGKFAQIIDNTRFVRPKPHQFVEILMLRYLVDFVQKHGRIRVVAIEVTNN